VDRIEEDEDENQITNRTFENLDIRSVSENSLKLRQDPLTENKFSYVEKSNSKPMLEDQPRLQNIYTSSFISHSGDQDYDQTKPSIDLISSPTKACHIK